MKIISVLFLAVCIVSAMAMPSKISTTYNDNYPTLKESFLQLLDELCNDHDYQTDNYNLFGQLVYLLLTLPDEDNYTQYNCRNYLNISKKALAVLLQLRNNDRVNYEKFDSHPKRTLDSIGGGHLIKRSEKIDI
ncbi:uncharacterized protein LOC105213443 isoform X2 [Zeugodacus cucurbitae]|uniref:uncharacterized protein LOC105213443 isoform X2 n=1 Tax=Zeugodacus cucurbitae TaxID=28588 RepID=UPI000596A834|nr:uncharacterized protein LOC105213443 isoform X2 [Zeugodacus cucurbitae]